MKNILFRTDSSSNIGTGHIMRDLVLADQFREANIIFATQDLEGNINDRIILAGYPVKILSSNDKEELVKTITELKVDSIIIDHYGIDYDYETYIKQKTNCKIMCLDDTYKKHNCDILLNHNISADVSKYSGLVPVSCELRCGSEYTLLRQEFIDEKKKKVTKSNSEIKTVFMAMGGTDHSNINIKILEVLEEFKNIRAIVVTTTANKNLITLKEYIKDKRTWIDLRCNSNKIAYLMNKSDFAIVSPSVTMNEVLFMELPFIAIKTAENQNDMYEYLMKNNYLVLKEFDSILLIKKILILYNYFSVGI